MEELSETTENYLKEIYLLVEKHQYARVSDIASTVKRSLSTVSGAIKKMAEDGLLNYERYGKITLTDLGNNLAESVVANYRLLLDFLVMIGVDVDQSKIDACEMEHISDVSISRLNDFIDYLKNDINGKKAVTSFISRNK